MPSPKVISRAQHLKALKAAIRDYDVDSLVTDAARRLVTDFRNGNKAEVLCRLQAINGPTGRVLVAAMMIIMDQSGERRDFYNSLYTAVEWDPPKPGARQILCQLTYEQIDSEHP